MGTTFSSAYFIPHAYPSPRHYRKGVRTITLAEDRPQPEIKNWRPGFRQRIKNLKALRDVYEVILINENGFVTEGSQSNVFMVRGGTLVTAPSHEVLPGITRKYVLEICRGQGIPVEERLFNLEEMAGADAVFLTGTSPKVLPVSGIDHLRFSPGNSLVRTIAAHYDELIEDYIKLHPYEP